MANLNTKYIGLELDNPLVVSSSGLTGSVEGVKQCADSGAGAVVLKSMFEELVVSQTANLDLDILQSEHPEAADYVRAELGMQLGPLPYLRFIEDVLRHVDIPVIASVNCISHRWWVPYAEDIEAAGADGLELNISHFPQGGDHDVRDIERQYSHIVEEVCSRVKIPVAVKIGPYFTSIESMVRELSAAGASAVVLFNRYYSVDVDIERKRFVPAVTLSSPEEITLPLRWVGLLADKVPCDLAASTGIFDGTGVVKTLMAGAAVACLSSVLYDKGVAYLAEIRRELEEWLDSHGYASVSDIRGVAGSETGNADILLHRLQYIKSLDEAAKYER
ncbi:MAG: dihydroorotate dehydrogenase-like protein [Candidatus Latescibacterota bacterium]